MLTLFAALGLGAMLASHAVPFPFLLEALAPARSRWRMPLAAVPTVYLTFDDGPNPVTTPALLDLLARHQVRATFFVIDRHLTEETAPIVRRMFQEGHAVALHSHTPKLMALEPEQLAARLTEAAERMRQLTGSLPCPAFRPHGGFRSGNMYAGLARIDYTLVGWGWMLWDASVFRKRSVDRVVRRVLDRVRSGGIVVMHDGHHVDPEADRRHTVETVAQLVPALRERGFRFETVCDALSK